MSKKSVISKKIIRILGGVFNYENSIGFQEIPYVYFDVPKELVKELENLQWEYQACDREFAYTVSKAERKELREEWSDLQKQIRDKTNKIMSVYGATCTEYYELDNPYSPHINFKSNKLIVPLCNQRRFVEAM